MNDVFTEALNSAPGRLAEVLISKISKGDGGELPKDLRDRLDRLVNVPGKEGLLARVTLAADVSFLFDCAPEWTKLRIIPLFEWSSPDASYVWSARKYSNYIGSPELFRYVKQPFLQMFGRSDVPPGDLEAFAEWLVVILIANQAQGADYPLLATEARSALRRAGASALASVGHHLAIEMESATPDGKLERWRALVGPVFQAIWPLDVEMQTPAATFKLVQILRATEDAFSEAADIIIPFIRPDDPRGSAAGSGRHRARPTRS